MEGGVALITQPLVPEAFVGQQEFVRRMTVSEQERVNRAPRRQDDPRYQRASKAAAEITKARDERESFYDEDDYIEHYRFLREDLYHGEFSYDYY